MKKEKRERRVYELLQTEWNEEERRDRVGGPDIFEREREERDLLGDSGKERRTAEERGPCVNILLVCCVSEIFVWAC
eukprot:scaffold113489_cov21-Tisochrysis_lutea.AAC.2